VARKVNANLVALGSAAIVTLYALGYARTQSAANPAAAPPAIATPPPAAGNSGNPNAANAPAVTTASPLPDTPTAIARAVATTPRAAAPSPTATAGTRYRDGTYRGSGTSRRGDITVELTVQNGQIGGVRITRSTTYYPTSAIARLPGEVVNRQSAQIDMVSGATESSRAFRGAVSQALSQAGAASSAVVPAIPAGVGG